MILLVILTEEITYTNPLIEEFMYAIRYIAYPLNTKVQYLCIYAIRQIFHLKNDFASCMGALAATGGDSHRK